jgi:hypothetical protein
MSIILSPQPKLQFISDNMVPMAGCLMYTYQAGTNTLLATYASEDGASNTNPIVLDAGGRANVWIDSNIAYKYVVKNRDGSILMTVDNINSSDGQTLIIVNTISALRAIDTTTFSGGVVEVLGYYAANDGGGGDFYFIPASTLTADNGIVVSPVTGTGRWVRLCDSEINVLWYGAKGDGVTDNTAYVQSANTYATAQSWNLFFPEGIFNLNSNPGFTVPVRLAPNAVLSWSGYTMSINPLFQAGDFTKHFACTSSAACSFAGLIEIYPEWFGAVGDGSFTDNIQTTDDTTPIQYAINSAKVGNSIVFNSTKKYWSGELTLLPGIKICGTAGCYENDTDAIPGNEYKANLQYNGTSTIFLNLSNMGPGGLRGITVRDLVIDGNSAATALISSESTRSLITCCTLRNANIGVAFTGSDPSTGNRVVFCNFTNLAFGITNHGAGCTDGFITDNAFVNCTQDLALDNKTGWLVHDNKFSAEPVIGNVNHLYESVSYNDEILGEVPVTSITTPPSAVLLGRIGGWADSSSSFKADSTVSAELNQTNIWESTYLMRYDTTNALGARVHNSLGYDSSAQTPRATTRAWYERDMSGNHHWGDLDKELMTLDNAGILSFPAYGDSGSIPIANFYDGDVSTHFAKLNYSIVMNNIIIRVDSYYTSNSSGTANYYALLDTKNWPCYSVANPTPRTILTTGTSTIPFQLGPVSITGFAARPWYQGGGAGRITVDFIIGQYVMLLPSTNIWGNYMAWPSDKTYGHSPMMYGQVTAWDGTTLVINIVYYRSGGGTNLVTNGYLNIFSAWPFLLKQPTTVHSQNEENCGVAILSTAGAVSYRLPEIGIIFDAPTFTSNTLGINPLVTQLQPLNTFSAEA